VSEDYRLEIVGSMARLTFTRPHKANAYHARMGNPIRRDFVDLQHRSDVRCLVICSEGRHFMAGGDLDTVTEIDGATPGELTAFGEAPIGEYNRMLRAMLQLEFPVIASVRGGVIGMAVGLVSACDFVIASSNSFFEAAHVRSASSSDGLLTYFLPRQIGLRKALELALLGDRISATEAKRLDLVNFEVPDDQLEIETDRLATRLAEGPTRAYAMIKSLMHASFGNSFDEQARMEAEGYGEILHTKDIREGIKAFFEKRPPVFRGE
jgi:2-(1,2-epoxy-1,2-dihydrophenyl)acetyl-CoA isomerase